MTRVALPPWFRRRKGRDDRVADIRVSKGLMALWLIACGLCAQAKGCNYGPPFLLDVGTTLYDRADHTLVGIVLRYETNHRMEDGSFQNAALMQFTTPRRDVEPPPAWRSRGFIMQHYAVKVCRP